MVLGNLNTDVFQKQTVAGLYDFRAPQGKVWQKRKGLSYCEGLTCGFRKTAVKMIVAISFEKGVIYSEQYEKRDGTYFADFV